MKPLALALLMAALPCAAQSVSSAYRPDRVNGVIERGGMEPAVMPPGPRLNLQNERVVWIALSNEHVDRRQRLPETEIVAAKAGTAAKAVVFFDFNSAVPRNPEVLDRLALDEAASVRIIGRADDLGPARYNQKLSERRAAAVASLLKARGVPAGRIVTEGRGEADPVGGYDTAGRALNRQAETLVEAAQ